MKTVHLHPSTTHQNCSRIIWCYSVVNFSNDIQRIIFKHDTRAIDCGKHNYMFMLMSRKPHIIPFTFPETNMLMQLMPNEPEQFYLKAALREYMNAFTVINSLGERVYPEDIV